MKFNNFIDQAALGGGSKPAKTRGKAATSQKSKPVRSKKLVNKRSKLPIKHLENSFQKSSTTTLVEDDEEISESEESEDEASEEEATQEETETEVDESEEEQIKPKRKASVNVKLHRSRKQIRAGFTYDNLGFA